MLWGAPLCFVLQARPVKMWSKILFYMMTNPPSIMLSLLPAPQQAILSFDYDKTKSAVYSTASEKAAQQASKFVVEEEDEEEEVEEDVSEDEESDEDVEDLDEDEYDDESEEED